MAVEDVNQEFEDAARNLSKCQDAFQYAQARNMPTNPVERQKSVMHYHKAYHALEVAQDRMRKARRAISDRYDIGDS